MTISKTQIEKKIKKKQNPVLVNTLIRLKKTNPELAQIIGMSKRKQLSLNIDEIENEIEKQGIKDKNILITGKILGTGECNLKDKKFIAPGFSLKAEEKLKSKGNEVVRLKEEIKKNPELKDIKILKWQR